MEPQGYHRKLTAIRSADIAGYSLLMQDDEATAKTLEANKQIFSDLIQMQSRSGVNLLKRGSWRCRYDDNHPVPDRRRGGGNGHCLTSDRYFGV